jgi:resuscitation-promoting factor RpfA
MLSGNGRHRRPRQAPALLVAAGVTGSAIAIPLLGATGASAATGTTWDRVAECESGGSWSENSGNGYYGGLQLTQGDWEKYGGLEYAETADQASRNQQIAVAEKILDDQGVGAFSTCGVLSGLAKDSDSAKVDTGVVEDLTGSSGSSSASDSSGLSDSSEESSSKSSSGSSGRSGGSGSSGSEASDSGDSSGSAASPETSTGSSTGGSSGGSSGKEGKEGEGENSTKSDKSATPSASESTPDAGDAQGPDGSLATPSDSDESDDYQQSLGTSNLVDIGSLAAGTGRHRGQSAEEAPRSYSVHAGDSLMSIADSLDVDGGWRALYAENKKEIGVDPNRIVPGQTLDVPVE